MWNDALFMLTALNEKTAVKAECITTPILMFSDPKDNPFPLINIIFIFLNVYTFFPFSNIKKTVCAKIS